ncbi:sulfurtransferase TusA family protein [Paramagnetospirillum magneticum]|uniref:Predicted redox protein, regulator of disulfide bond formation n=1 Tax=Paramagnetospirillum magneticum (strain ATCC 700264 / AMB-1) TaxID=342108 RepID=Q2VYR3_PARM1|nr:sulfurtransferase TusA family protein [Paramagnetospirillum magneticum]BAE53262.1 Predicted redox protein, regulator of disulfide bond formation [Paramagnetospirillum magneticum AMB-1]
MTEKPNYSLDITNEVCPMTFVKTKLLVERMISGEIVDVRLKGAEPLGNVPRSLAELGHEILSLAPEPGEGPTGIHHLVVCKK